ncbi:hypothetical protein RHO14_07455 [Orbus wheelerorum]|uniref:hypothetical protein n=1 Tax=Orbus wheelerorum TaxID=3074111 RepID=UPI00370DA544
MAIYFERLPEKQIAPQFPRWWVWPLLFILFLIIGASITLSISLDNTISNGWFLGGVFFIPLVSWIFVAGFWFYWLTYCQDYAISWNKQYDARYAELTLAGQQPLYVLFSALYTEQGYQGTAQKITKEGVSIQTKMPYQGTKAVAHSKLVFEDDLLLTTLDLRAKNLFERLYKQISPIFIEPWIHYPIHVRFCVDTELDQKQLLALWQNVFSSYRFVSIEFIEPTQSSWLIDTWIDNDIDGLLLVVSMHLFDSPQEKEGEAFSALLLAGESILSDKKAKEAITTQSVELVTLHRPEIGHDLDKVIHHGVLWGAKEAAELTTVWYSHIELDSVPMIATKLDEQGIKLKHMYHLDNTIGHTGNCAYFTALALASEHARSTEDKQLVVCQGDEMSASVVMRSILL